LSDWATRPGRTHHDVAHAPAVVVVDLHAFPPTTRTSVSDRRRHGVVDACTEAERRPAEHGAVADRQAAPPSHAAMMHGGLAHDDGRATTVDSTNGTRSARRPGACRGLVRHDEQDAECHSGDDGEQ